MIVRNWLAALALPALFTFRAAAQDIPLDLFSSLAPKATEHVDLNIDSNLLQLAAQFMNANDPQQAKIKDLVAGLKGIYVRSYTFAKPGEYSMADVEKARAQLKGWNEVVSVHEANENTGIYVKTDGQKILGLVVLAAEPTELTLVNISGAFWPDLLKDLSGKFGIPDLGALGEKGEKEKGEKKKKEE
jgi:Domain of unknown function (DUF4252)